MGMCIAEMLLKLTVRCSPIHFSVELIPQTIFTVAILIQLNPKYQPQKCKQFLFC